MLYESEPVRPEFRLPLWHIEPVPGMLDLVSENVVVNTPRKASQNRDVSIVSGIHFTPPEMAMFDPSDFGNDDDHSTTSRPKYAAVALRAPPVLWKATNVK